MIGTTVGISLMRLFAVRKSVLRQRREMQRRGVRFWGGELLERKAGRPLFRTMTWCNLIKSTPLLVVDVDFFFSSG